MARNEHRCLSSLITTFFISRYASTSYSVDWTRNTSFGSTTSFKSPCML